MERFVADNVEKRKRLFLNAFNTTSRKMRN